MELSTLQPMAQPTVSYREWTQPVLDAAVESLLADQPKGNADLRDQLLLLPTRQAGRRLREALAWEMHERGGALFPPMTTTPWRFVRPSEDVAPELACLWHWETTLAQVDLEQFRNLFPRPPEDNVWRRQMARQLHELRATLAENGLDFAAVAESGHCPEEAARWRDLKKLEATYRKSLGESVDRHDAQRAAAGQPELPPEIQRVIVMAVPDLPVIVQCALEELLVKGMPVELIVFGPAGGEGLFDAWGRPVPDDWLDRELPITNADLFPWLDEAAQAAEITTCLNAYGKNRPVHVAVGVADPAITPPLERAMADADVSFFNPNGRPLHKAPLFIFLKALQTVLCQPTFANAEAFLSLPDAWGWARGVAEGFSPTTLLEGFDDLRQHHLPATLADAADFYFADEDYRGARVAARDLLKALATELARIDSTPLSDGLAGFLKATFAERQFREGNEQDTADLETASQFMARLAEWETAVSEGSRPMAATALGLLLEVIGREAVHPERSTDAVDIQGWLELAWEDAPHLILAGANEGCVPETIHGDVFLPEALRKRLGLRTNEDRFARDAWLLELLLQTRMDKGRVEILLGQQCANGDPLKPSRLLFRCADDDLPARVGHLFKALPFVNQPPAWNAVWQLRVDVIQSVEKIGVTSFSVYLDCPYRFYLGRVLRMEALDLRQRELDARGFGSLMHDVLDAFGKDSKARKLRDPDAIQAFLIAELKCQVERRFGKQPALPLRMQAMTAERRLYQTAIAQAQARVEGWEIVKTEDQFRKELDGLIVSGRIDCVEENKKTGAVRVLDYKSSNTAKPPAVKHWKRMPREYDEDSVRPYARFDLNGREHYWTDLQLPLYAWALEADFGPDLALGYFNLPAIGTDTGVALLEPFGRDFQASALACARGVVADLKTNRFWPPAEHLNHDDFEDILFGQPRLTAAQPEEATV